MEHGEFLKSIFTDRNSAVKEFLKKPPAPLYDGGKEADQKVMDSITVDSIIKSYAMKGAGKTTEEGTAKIKDLYDSEAYWFYKNKGYLKRLGFE
jgi:hypothetical protein